jgi:hypothetical protein
MLLVFQISLAATPELKAGVKYMSFIEVPANQNIHLGGQDEEGVLNLGTPENRLDIQFLDEQWAEKNNITFSYDGSNTLKTTVNVGTKTHTLTHDVGSLAKRFNLSHLPPSSPSPAP